MIANRKAVLIFSYLLLIESRIREKSITVGVSHSRTALM
jgi:hypothetical protein